MGSAYSNNLSDSDLDYGDDGYIFKPTRSDGDTAGHVRRSDDSEEALVVA